MNRFCLHAKEVTDVYGPRLAVIWSQGCERKCPGCMNPGTHQQFAGTWVSSSDLTQWVRAAVDQHGARGVLLTGGEPLEQPRLVDAVLGLSVPVILMTGAELSAVPTLFSSWWRVDLLIAGPFIQRLPSHRIRLFGSSNRAVLAQSAVGFDLLHDIEAEHLDKVRVDVLVDDMGGAVVLGGPAGLGVREEVKRGT